MILHHYCCFLLLASPLALAGATSDAVNERIPVSAAELEAHWQVDCRAVWDRLLAQAHQALASDRCDIPAATRRDVELCAFIYHPPGGASRRDCPDFRGALHLLDRVSEEGCAVMAALLGEIGTCPLPAP